MPICNKPPPTSLGSKSASEIDDHASEAAKVKRTREQAYFNSYNFDAIEVLPYNDGELGEVEAEEGEDDDDDDDDDDDANRDLKGIPRHCHSNRSKLHYSTDKAEHSTTAAATPANATATLPLAAAAKCIHTLPHQLSPSRRRYLSNASRLSKSNSSSGRSTNSSRSSNGSAYLHPPHGDMKFTYLQRLGALLISNGSVEPIRTEDVPEANSCRNNKITIERGDGIVISVHSGSSENTATNNPDNGSFLLPRAMLKYQGVGISNSMPLAASAAYPGMEKLLQNGGSGNSCGTTKSNHNHNNHLAISNGNGKTLVMTTATINNNSANSSPYANNKARLNYPINSSDSRTGFLKTSHTITEREAATSRIKKESTSSTREAPSKVSLEKDERQSEIVHLRDRNNVLAAAITTATTTTTEKVTPTAVAATAAAAATATATSPALVKSFPAISTNVNTANNTTATNTSAASTSLSAESVRRGRTNSHQSHYSTDKSGSSGYYSSNVCSTYSLEDHIYCEPVIDILDLNSKSKSVLVGKAGGSGGSGGGGGVVVADIVHHRHPHPKQTTILCANNSATVSDSRIRDMNGTGQSKKPGKCEDDGEGDDDEDADTDTDADADADYETDGHMVPRRSQKSPQYFNENLRILETSIENLDRHLKNFPSLSSQERIASFVQSHPSYMQHTDIGEKFRVYNHLPTIVEGNIVDAAKSQPRLWQHEIADDSLLDIDLDSFLLVDERNNKGRCGKPVQSKLSDDGIDNPGFLTDEQEEENNYKCVKYINSCPEDAYRVESDIGAGTRTGTVSEKSISIEHYPKRYEDQLHFQSTRELLEDVRDKIRLLSQTNSEIHSNIDTGSVGPAQSQLIPKELDDMIRTLKRELETYLDRMNQHSELEIRQLCSGLVKNQNIVKMKKAFERRRSVNSLGALDFDHGFSAYEAIRDGALIPVTGVPVSIRQQITSIRCASDPNFKMRRKSLSEVFPVTSYYIETEQRQVADGNGRKSEAQQIKYERDYKKFLPIVKTQHSQMQRNLSFQQPVLNNLDSRIGPAGIGGESMAGQGSGAGSASGGDSAESGDKDNVHEWHRKKPSIWEMYYGTNRMNQSLLGKRNGITTNGNHTTMSYPSSRPESDFTLDLPRAEQLRIKMEKEKKFRQRCRYITTFLSLVFFLLTVMVVSLVLTRGKRMFGSMI